jgi:hypothetical protein
MERKEQLSLYKYGFENYLYKRLGFSATDSQRNKVFWEFMNMTLHFKEFNVDDVRFLTISGVREDAEYHTMIDSMKDYIIYVNDKYVDSDISECLIPCAFAQKTNGMTFIKGATTDIEKKYLDKISFVVEKSLTGMTVSTHIMVFILDNIKLRKLKLNRILKD